MTTIMTDLWLCLQLLCQLCPELPAVGAVFLLLLLILQLLLLLLLLLPNESLPAMRQATFHAMAGSCQGLSGHGHDSRTPTAASEHGERPLSLAGRPHCSPCRRTAFTPASYGHRSRKHQRPPQPRQRPPQPKGSGPKAPWHEHDATPQAWRCCQQCWPQQPKSQPLAAGLVKHTAQRTIGPKEGGAGASPATHLRNMFACKDYKKGRERGLANDIRLSQDLLS